MWGKLRDVDGWVRNRLRYCIWKDWKKPERKRKSLIRLGVDQDHAYAWSRTCLPVRQARKGGWAIAQSPILNTTITLSRLAKRGYEAMLAHYQKVAPHLNEPLYTRPAWFTQSEAEGYSGVRGAPRRRKAAGPPTRLVAVCWARRSGLVRRRPV